MQIEADIIRFLQSNASTGWITLFQIITYLGSYLGLFITFVIIFSRNKKLSLALVVTFAISAVANHMLKAIIGRARPFDTYNDIANYGGEDGFSMPSGHSVCAGVFATFLVYNLFQTTKNRWTRALGTTAYASLMAVVGFSRMVLGVHYISDVALGITLGIIFAIAGIIVYNVIVKKFIVQKR
ncbi:MAG: phosphatase PAP2 family protein [Clostridia bacterium]|nr:phosphatase PAP2 family protein [Clostridia bacterium]